MTVHALSTDERLTVLQDENEHLAAFLDDLRRSARAVVDAAPVSKEALRIALIEMRDQLDSLDRIAKTVGGWGASHRVVMGVRP